MFVEFHGGKIIPIQIVKHNIACQIPVKKDQVGQYEVDGIEIKQQ